MIKIMLVDDHQIFRDSIRLLFSFENDLEVVGDVSDGIEVLDMLAKLQPDIILMDISMQDLGGVETTHLVKKLYPHIKILILSMNSESHHILNALEAGVDGYLLKSAGRNEVLRAIRAVHEGSSYFSKEVSYNIVRQLSQQNKPKEERQEVPLTAREIEILSLIAQEYSNPEIAEKLFISVRTVDSHRRNIIEKLGVKNTAGLVRYAIENELLPVS